MKLRIIVAALGILACEQPRENPIGQSGEVRDSAGIHIVQNPRPPAGSRLPWRIGPAPAASIGVLDGEDPYMLYRASDATKLSDGRIGRGQNPGRKSSKVL